MKLNSTLLLAVLSASLFSMTALADSWVQDDNSWKTASPYYYGDSDSAVQKDPYQNQTARKRRKKEIATRETSPFAPDSNNVSLDIGQNFLIGSQYQDAIGLQGTYTYGVSRLFAFSSTLGYSSHSNGDYSLMHVEAGPRLNLANYDRVTPYVNAGLGFYHASEDLTTTNSIGGTMFGLSFGGGADLQLTKETFFGASLEYHELFGTKQDTTAGTVDLGSDFVTFMAHIGYTF